MKKILLFLIIILFLFLRFYQIDKSLFFFNDMGRDALVLQEWKETGKPPLLGPQTSALPINQSPIYFYYLYPFFLLTQGSPNFALYANAFLYITFFIALFIVFKKQQPNLLIIFFLVSIHPQYIIQSRFVWNPSLVTPFILFSLFFLLHKKAKRAGFFLAIAIALSFSVAPLAIATVLFLLIKNRPKVADYLFGIASGLLLTNIPLLVYELRHHFQLTKSLIIRGSEPQPGALLITKMTALANFIITLPSPTLNLIIFLIITLFCLIVILRKANIAHKDIALLMILTLVINLITPIAIQPHYIFAFTSIIFILISFINWPSLIIVLLLTSLSYINASNLTSYFSAAPRSYSQMKNCFINVCKTVRQPLYISVNSSFHPFHNGPEHQFLAKISGCNVKKLENGTDLANTMLVVGDKGTYNPSKTAYYELSQFGPSSLTNTFNCFQDFTIYQITKLNQSN